MRPTRGDEIAYGAKDWWWNVVGRAQVEVREGICARIIWCQKMHRRRRSRHLKEQEREWFCEGLPQSLSSRITMLVITRSPKVIQALRAVARPG